MLPLPKGTLTFTFAGGPRDGSTEVVDPARTSPKNVFLRLAWSNTRGGQIGRQWTELTAARVEHMQKTGEGVPQQLQVYEIVGRVEREGNVTLHCEYRGLRPNGLQI